MNNHSPGVPTPVPAWTPNESFIQTTNIARLIQEKNFKNYHELHRWSVTDVSLFWQTMTHLLDIRFDKSYSNLIDLAEGIESPQWFKDAKLNIANSCFKAEKGDCAIISQSEQGTITKLSYEALDKLSNQIANSLQNRFKKGDRVAIIMPMNGTAVSIYLGIIKAGCSVVSIADSFASNEIALRLTIAKVNAVFTQDYIVREGKTLPLYNKMIEANAPFTVVLPVEEGRNTNLRKMDIHWKDFLDTNTVFKSISCCPKDYINILFSSGTTGEPKAIPWTHTTPIKCATDAYLHHNLKPQDIFCWPSNLGWMMGPWLIFASLLNNATLAIYEGSPNGRAFGTFIQDVKVNLLGVVPTLVKTWRNSRCMEGLDWDSLKLFTSTGECSNGDDMLYLMSLANNKPIIEYCGGTEIGGAYITGTVIEPSAPGAFTTPALGLDFVIIDENGEEADTGEAALIPPSIGLSTELLNADHHQVYYANMPKLPQGKILRRHGDQIQRYPNGFYRVLGRVDDTMNLAGIKVSSATIESVLNTVPMIYETAAISVAPQTGGPGQLVIYAVLKSTDNRSRAFLTSLITHCARSSSSPRKRGSRKKFLKTMDSRFRGNDEAERSQSAVEHFDHARLKTDLQNAIKQHLNPLFKIQDVIIVSSLPRTASNKVMRRVLREAYLKNHSNSP